MKHQKAVKRAYKQWPSDSDNEAYEEKPVDEIMQYMHTNLTPQTQNVIQMRYNQKMRYNEIARELGISRIAVYKHLSQGIGKLRLRFNPTPFIRHLTADCYTLPRTGCLYRRRCASPSPTFRMGHHPTTIWSRSPFQPLRPHPLEHY